MCALAAGAQSHRRGAQGPEVRGATTGRGAPAPRHLPHARRERVNLPPSPNPQPNPEPSKRTRTHS
eukprot:993751-Prymnesium_polylepis.1